MDNSAMLVGLYELSENIRNTTAVCFKPLEVLIHSSIETTEPQHVTLTAWIRISLEKLTVAGYQKVLAWVLIRNESSYPRSKQHVTVPVMGQKKKNSPHISIQFV